MKWKETTEMGLSLSQIDRVLCWNVRGVNNINKQKAVKDLIHRYVVGLVGLLETKVKAPNLDALYQRVFIG